MEQIEYLPNKKDSTPEPLGKERSIDAKKILPQTDAIIDALPLENNLAAPVEIKDQKTNSLDKEYFRNRLYELLKDAQESNRIFKEQMHPLLSNVPKEDTNFNIGINALRQLAEDPQFPKDRARALKIALVNIELRKSAHKHESAHDTHNLQHLNKGSQNILVDALKDVLPEDMIENFKQLGE